MSVKGGRLLRRVILNADDFGMTDGVCRAIVELLDTGAISSTTLMLAAEGSVSRCRAWKIHERASRAGVHLQLTSGRPLMPASSVPSLVRANGEFRDRADLPDFKVDDVEREWRRQIEVATEILGQLPTHLDSHHGVHHLEQFAPLFSKLALEFGLPVRDRTAMFLLGAASTLTGSDVVLYDWTAKGLGAPALEEQLNAAFVGSAETSVIEVVTHPGYSDYALRKISSLSDLREIDREALVQFSRSEWLSRSGGTLVPFSYIGPSAGGP